MTDLIPVVPVEATLEELFAAAKVSVDRITASGNPYLLVSIDADKRAHVVAACGDQDRFYAGVVVATAIGAAEIGDEALEKLPAAMRNETALITGLTALQRYAPSTPAGDAAKH